MTGDDRQVPSGGVVAGESKVKLPDTDAAPPISVESASACPTMMTVAVGHNVTVGVACETTSVALVQPW